MTKQLSAIEFSTVSQANFAILRSELLDEFARFEILVCRCLKKFGNESDPENAPLAQRIKTLSSTKPGPHLSKVSATELSTLADETKRLLKWRAAIVHSQMEIGIRDGIDVAMFRNAVNVAKDIPDYVVLSRDDFAKLGSMVCEIARPLEIRLNPPSSQPQPKLGAKADP